MIPKLSINVPKEDPLDLSNIPIKKCMQIIGAIANNKNRRLTYKYALPTTQPQTRIIHITNNNVYITIESKTDNKKRSTKYPITYSRDWILVQKVLNNMDSPIKWLCLDIIKKKYDKCELKQQQKFMLVFNTLLSCISIIDNDDIKTIIIDNFFTTMTDNIIQDVYLLDRTGSWSLFFTTFCGHKRYMSLSNYQPELNSQTQTLDIIRNSLYDGRKYNRLFTSECDLMISFIMHACLGVSTNTICRNKCTYIVGHYDVINDVTKILVYYKSDPGCVPNASPFIDGKVKEILFEHIYMYRNTSTYQPFYRTFINQKCTFYQD